MNTDRGLRPSEALLHLAGALLVLAGVSAPLAAGNDRPTAGPYAGLKTVTLENEELRLTVVPRVGARVVELLSKKSGLNHLLHDPAAFNSYRNLDIGEGFLLMAGGLFDVVLDNGRQGYPGHFQCAPYQVTAERRGGSPAIVAVCTRGSVEVTRRMTLASGPPRLRIEVTYRNVSAAPMAAGVNLRAEFSPSKGKPSLVAVPSTSGLLGLYDECRGLDRLEIGDGWILLGRRADDGLLMLFDRQEADFVRGFSGRGMYALTVHQKPRRLAAGQATSFALELAPFAAPAEARRLTEAAALRRLLSNLDAVRTHPRGPSVLTDWGLVSLPSVAYARARPWAGERTAYRAGDDVRVVSRRTRFAAPAAAAPETVELGVALALPDGRDLAGRQALPAGKDAGPALAGAKIGAVTGPFRLDWTLAADGRRLAAGKATVRYHHRGDPRIPALIAQARGLLAEVRSCSDSLKHAARALPWIDKRLEYAENLHEIGDYRYRPFCHGRAREDMYGSSASALHLLKDAIRCAKAVLAGRDPVAEILPGGHVFAYDLAPYGARIVPFKDPAFSRKLKAFKAKVDALAARPEAAKDVGWYMALYLLARRAVEDGIRADDGDAAAAAAGMHKWMDDLLARVDKWPDDGWTKGKFRFPYAGLIGFYTSRIERCRGYAVYVPGGHDGQTARAVLVDPNSYGNLMPAQAPPAEGDPATQLGGVESNGYFLLWPGHTNTYSRSGNPDDVRRVIKDAAGVLRMDRDRFYCAGGSLNADATGNLANSMLDTWAAVAPFSQGGQLWTRKTAALPRVSFQAGSEVVVFTKGVTKYRGWGVYDPKIHLGGLYPGVGHCGMNRDMWQYVFDFFARHRRRE